MRPGTPGFNGNRLRAAREVRALTQKALADLLGITHQAVSGYESGAQTPAPQVMRVIAEKLRLPPHHFLLPSTPEETDTIFCRSMESTTQTARRMSERRFGWLRDLVHYLRGLVQFPPVKFPDFDFPANPTRISEREIEEAATETRRFWNLGDKPISNVVWLIENNGAVMARYDLGDAKLDAFSEWNSQEATPYVILGSGKESGTRSRYDAGHELGHMILHRRVDKKCLNDKAMFKLIESQAHRFAGAFLLPDSTFSREFEYTPTLDHFVGLKTKWLASIQFMIMRAHDLGIITEEYKARLFKNVSARRWRLKEIYDELIPIERPRLLRRSIEMLVNRSIIDASEIPFRLALMPNDVEDLAGLDRGFLGGADLDRFVARPFPEGSSEVEDIDPKPNIFRFPKAE